jgi:hypothetical protein
MLPKVVRRASIWWQYLWHGAGRLLLKKIAELIPRHPNRQGRKPQAAVKAESSAAAAGQPSKQQQQQQQGKKGGKKKKWVERGLFRQLVVKFEECVPHLAWN